MPSWNRLFGYCVPYADQRTGRAHTSQPSDIMANFDVPEEDPESQESQQQQQNLQSNDGSEA